MLLSFRIFLKPTHAWKSSDLTTLLCLDCYVMSWMALLMVNQEVEYLCLTSFKPGVSWAEWTVIIQCELHYDFPWFVGKQVVDWPLFGSCNFNVLSAAVNEKSWVAQQTHNSCDVVHINSGWPAIKMMIN